MNSNPARLRWRRIRLGGKKLEDVLFRTFGGLGYGTRHPFISPQISHSPNEIGYKDEFGSVAYSSDRREVGFVNCGRLLRICRYLHFSSPFPAGSGAPREFARWPGWNWSLDRQPLFRFRGRPYGGCAPFCLSVTEIAPPMNLWE